MSVSSTTNAFKQVFNATDHIMTVNNAAQESVKNAPPGTTNAQIVSEATSQVLAEELVDMPVSKALGSVNTAIKLTSLMTKELVNNPAPTPSTIQEMTTQLQNANAPLETGGVSTVEHRVAEQAAALLRPAVQPFEQATELASNVIKNEWQRAGKQEIEESQHDLEVTDKALHVAASHVDNVVKAFIQGAGSSEAQKIQDSVDNTNAIKNIVSNIFPSPAPRSPVLQNPNNLSHSQDLPLSFDIQQSQQGGLLSQKAPNLVNPSSILPSVQPNGPSITHAPSNSTQSSQASPVNNSVKPLNYSIKIDPAPSIQDKVNQDLKNDIVNPPQPVPQWTDNLSVTGQLQGRSLKIEATVGSTSSRPTTRSQSNIQQFVRDEIQNQLDQDHHDRPIDIAYRQQRKDKAEDLRHDHPGGMVQESHESLNGAKRRTKDKHVVLSDGSRVDLYEHSKNFGHKAIYEIAGVDQKLAEVVDKAKLFRGKASKSDKARDKAMKDLTDYLEDSLKKTQPTQEKTIPEQPQHIPAQNTLPQKPIATPTSLAPQPPKPQGPSSPSQSNPTPPKPQDPKPSPPKVQEQAKPTPSSQESKKTTEFTKAIPTLPKLGNSPQAAASFAVPSQQTSQGGSSLPVFPPSMGQNFSRTLPNISVLDNGNISFGNLPRTRAYTLNLLNVENMRTKGAPLFKGYFHNRNGNMVFEQSSSMNTQAQLMREMGNMNPGDLVDMTVSTLSFLLGTVKYVTGVAFDTTSIVSKHIYNAVADEEWDRNKKVKMHGDTVKQLEHSLYQVTTNTNYDPLTYGPLQHLGLSQQPFSDKHLTTLVPQLHKQLQERAALVKKLDGIYKNEKAIIDRKEKDTNKYRVDITNNVITRTVTVTVSCAEEFNETILAIDNLNKEICKILKQKITELSHEKTANFLANAPLLDLIKTKNKNESELIIKKLKEKGYLYLDKETSDKLHRIYEEDFIDNFKSPDVKKLFNTAELKKQYDDLLSSWDAYLLSEKHALDDYNNLNWLQSLLISFDIDRFQKPIKEGHAKFLENLKILHLQILMNNFTRVSEDDPLKKEKQNLLKSLQGEKIPSFDEQQAYSLLATLPRSLFYKNESFWMDLGVPSRLLFEFSDDLQQMAAALLQEYGAKKAPN